MTYCQITFKLLKNEIFFRDEEKKIIDKLMPNCPKLDSCKSKHKYFEAHPVPLECQIPLFDKIMYEKEKRYIKFTCLNM